MLSRGAPRPALRIHDDEQTAIRPLLPNKPRDVPRVDEILDDFFWLLHSGAPWRDLPGSFGLYTTCYIGSFAGQKAGIWDKIMAALTVAHYVAVQTTARRLCAYTSTGRVLPATENN
jgi:transposase